MTYINKNALINELYRLTVENPITEAEKEQNRTFVRVLEIINRLPEHNQSEKIRCPHCGFVMSDDT